ncbi:hypothetical protein K8R43_03790 [archaeon]|nr:hypothetical protein [archaeon]
MKLPVKNKFLPVVALLLIFLALGVIFAAEHFRVRECHGRSSMSPDRSVCAASRIELKNYVERYQNAAHADGKLTIEYFEKNNVGNKMVCYQGPSLGDAIVTSCVIGVSEDKENMIIIETDGGNCSIRDKISQEPSVFEGEPFELNSRLAWIWLGPLPLVIALLLLLGYIVVNRGNRKKMALIESIALVVVFLVSVYLFFQHGILSSTYPGCFYPPNETMYGLLGGLTGLFALLALVLRRSECELEWLEKRWWLTGL